MKTGAWISLALFGGVLACSGAAPSTGGSTTGFPGTSSGGAAASNGDVSNEDAGGTRRPGKRRRRHGRWRRTGRPRAPRASRPPTRVRRLCCRTPISPDADSLGPPITLTMDAFTVPPNAEVYKCQQFGNPFGKDVDLVKMVGTMSAGSHHFFLFNMSPSTYRNTAAPLGDCPDKGLEFHPFPFLSQQPK